MFTTLEIKEMLIMNIQSLVLAVKQADKFRRCSGYEINRIYGKKLTFGEWLEFYSSYGDR